MPGRYAAPDCRSVTERIVTDAIPSSNYDPDERFVPPPPLAADEDGIADVPELAEVTDE